MSRSAWRLAAGALGLAILGCAANPPPPADAGAPGAPAAPAGGGAEGGPDGGTGTTGRAAAPGFLTREDVTVRMAGAGLIVDVLPMNPEVLSLATDDLRRYLEEALKKVPDTVPPDLQRQGTFFLVGFSSTEKEVEFEPSLVHLDSEGRRYYPRYIVPVSTGFDDKVLELFKPVWAVYIYDSGIDLVSTLEFGYQDEISTRGAWRLVVQKVEEARGRAQR